MTPGNQNSPLRGKDFAFLDDVDGRQTALVCFNRQHLEIVAKTGTNVLECNHMEQLLVGDAAIDIELVPVVKDAAAQKQTVQTRGAMLFPPKLVPFVIGKYLTPRQAYLTLFPIIKDKGLLTECDHLVNFLRVGCTSTTAGPPLVAQKMWVKTR